MADRKAIARRLWGKKCCTQAASTFKRVHGLTARQPDSPGCERISRLRGTPQPRFRQISCLAGHAPPGSLVRGGAFAEP